MSSFKLIPTWTVKKNSHKNKKWISKVNPSHAMRKVKIMNPRRNYFKSPFLKSFGKALSMHSDLPNLNCTIFSITKKILILLHLWEFDRVRLLLSGILPKEIWIHDKYSFFLALNKQYKMKHWEWLWMFHYLFTCFPRLYNSW